MKNVIEIKKDFEVPGTDILLEKGDKIRVLKEAKNKYSINVKINNSTIKELKAAIASKNIDDINLLGWYAWSDFEDSFWETVRKELSTELAELPDEEQDDGEYDEFWKGFRDGYMGEDYNL